MDIVYTLHHVFDAFIVTLAALYAALMTIVGLLR